ncbi:MAG: hypothetical protein OXG65_09840 [Chloroflexi bacterium]|nr:hypothetical protein [Chloroflexota bacterium]
MSPELIGILSVGAAMLIGLGGVVSVNVALYRGLRSDMAALRGELKAEIAVVQQDTKTGISDVREDVKALETRVAAVEHGQARLTGVVEGLFAGLGSAQPDRESESAA